MYRTINMPGHSPCLLWVVSSFEDEPQACASVSERERERESRDARFIEGRNRQAEYSEFRRIQGFWSATSTLTPDGKM